MKNILFLTHSNNDIDHFLPLIVTLKESKRFEPIMFFLKPPEEALISKAHQWVLDTYGIRRLFLADIQGVSPVIRIMLRAWRYCILRTQLLPFRKLLKEARFYRLFLKCVYISIDRVLNKSSRYFFPPAALCAFIRKEQCTMVVVDEQRIHENPPYADVRSYATSVIIACCKKENNIPVFMMPHGVFSIINPGTCVFFQISHSESGNDVFKPDVLVLNSEVDRSHCTELIDAHTAVEVLGSIRYDNAWNEYIQSVSLKEQHIAIEKKRFTVLFVVAPFVAYPETNEEIHKTIFNLVSLFPEIELWVKNHPRYPWFFDFDACVKEHDATRIRIFRNELDTNILMHYADLVVSPLSSVLVQAILDKKAVIMYDAWKQGLRFDGETFFDNTPSVLKVSTPKELYACCARVMSGENPNRNEAIVEEFYKTRISAGRDRKESIVARYFDVIQKFS